MDLYILFLYNLVYMYLFIEGSIIYNLLLIVIQIKYFLNLFSTSTTILYFNGLSHSKRIIFICIYIIILLIILVVSIHNYRLISFIYVTGILYLLVISCYTIELWFMCIESINILTSVILFI